MKKVVVITGTSTGIGYTLANYLSKRNYIVYGLSRTIATESYFTTISTDITQKEAVTKAIEKIFNNEKRIDFLINNAGKGMVGSIEDATQEEIESLFLLNLVACTHTISAVLPIMRMQQQGKIINISSIGSEMGLPYRGFYSASKSALDRVVEAIRYEVSSFHVSVTSVHLGDVRTNIAESRVKSAVSIAYEKDFNIVYEGMNKHVNEGITTELVAVYLEKLLQKKSLKPHYYFGKFGQKIGIYLKRTLPQLWFERLMFKYAEIKR